MATAADAYTDDDDDAEDLAGCTPRLGWLSPPANDDDAGTARPVSPNERVGADAGEPPVPYALIAPPPLAQYAEPQLLPPMRAPRPLHRVHPSVRAGRFNARTSALRHCSALPPCAADASLVCDQCMGKFCRAHVRMGMDGGRFAYTCAHCHGTGGSAHTHAHLL